jgi:hypothetical protein
MLTALAGSLDGDVSDALDAPRRVIDGSSFSTFVLSGGRPASDLDLFRNFCNTLGSTR